MNPALAQTCSRSRARLRAGRRVDPGLRREILEPEVLAVGERVVGGQDGEQRVVEQVDGLDVVDASGLRVGGDDQVDVARMQPPHRLVGFGLQRVIPTSGCAAGSWRSRAGAAVAPAVANVARCSRPALSPGAARTPRPPAGRARMRAGLVDEHAPHAPVEPHPARAAVQQPDADLALERDDLLRDRRRGVGERVGGRAQRGVVGDRAQHAQAAGVEHAAELTGGVKQFDLRAAGAPPLGSTHAHHRHLARAPLRSRSTHRSTPPGIPSRAPRFDATLVRVRPTRGSWASAAATRSTASRRSRTCSSARTRCASRATRGRSRDRVPRGPPWPVEAALWDLAGQALGVPCATLLGGAADRLPAYASLAELRAPGRRAPSTRSRCASRVPRAQGAHRPRPGRGGRRRRGGHPRGGRRRRWTSSSTSTSGGGCRATSRPGLGVRRAAPGRGARCAEHGVLWVEEPLPGERPRGMRALREQTGVPVAGGEMARTFEELLRGVRARCARRLPARRGPRARHDAGAHAGRARCSRATGASRRTRGRTGSACWPTCTSSAASAAARTSSSRSTRPTWTPERRDFMLAEPVGVDAEGCLRVPGPARVSASRWTRRRIALHRSASWRWRHEHRQPVVDRRRRRGPAPHGRVHRRRLRPGRVRRDVRRPRAARRRASSPTSPAAAPRTSTARSRAARRGVRARAGSCGRRRPAATCCCALADLMEDRVEDLALLESLDVGKPIGEALRVDVPSAAACLRFYGEAVDKCERRAGARRARRPRDGRARAARRRRRGRALELPADHHGLEARARRWRRATRVVLKPAEQSPLSALLLAELAAEAGFPTASSTSCPGFGPEAGEPLGRHPDVDKIAFTGSVRVGRRFHGLRGRVQRQAVSLGARRQEPARRARRRRRPRRRRPQAIAWGIFYNAGQTCHAGSRLVVDEDGARGARRAHRRRRGRGSRPAIRSTRASAVGSLVDEEAAAPRARGRRAARSPAALRWPSEGRAPRRCRAAATCSRRCSTT